MVVLSWHRSLIWKKVHLSRLAIVGNRLVWFFYIGQNRWVFHIGWYRPIPIIFPISTDPNFKWPKPIDLATSYSYNSVGGDGDGHGEIYFNTPPNFSKLLLTPSKLFQTLSTLVQTLSKCVQTRPNVSKRVQMHLNAPNLFKFVQFIYSKQKLKVTFPIFFSCYFTVPPGTCDPGRAPLELRFYKVKIFKMGKISLLVLVEAP